MRAARRTYNERLYNPAFSGGVRVDAFDANGDNRADVVTDPGAGGPHVLVFASVTLSIIANFFAYRPLYFGAIFAGRIG